MTMSAISPSMMFAATKKKPAKSTPKTGAKTPAKAAKTSATPVPQPIHVGVSGYGESEATIEKMKTLGQEAGGFLAALNLDVAEVTVMLNNSNVLITLGTQEDLDKATAAMKAAPDKFRYNSSSIRGDQFYSKTAGLGSWDIALKTYGRAFTC